MKIKKNGFVPSCILLLLLAGCSSKSEIDKLKEEIIDLELTNSKLQSQLAEYDDALVIPFDEVNKYLMTVAFGPSEVKRNEESLFSTYLVLSNLPSNMSADWSCKPEGMKVQSEGIGYHVSNFYESTGTKEFRGDYTLVFPNGVRKKIAWKREFEVK